MGRKPHTRKKPRKKDSAQATALQQHNLALERHTKALNRSSEVLAAHTAVLSNVTARQIVYSVLNEPLTLPDTTPLSKLLFDADALSGIPGKLLAYHVTVQTAAVQACKTIADLVKVVAAAM